MGLVHNKSPAIIFESCKNFHQCVYLFMILIYIQQYSNSGFILNNRTIAFISFNYQPLSHSYFGIANLTFFNNTYQACTTYNTGLHSSIFQYIKKHGGSSTFSRSATNSDCFFTTCNQGQQFTAFNNGNSKLPCFLYFNNSVFNCSAGNY